MNVMIDLTPQDVLSCFVFIFLTRTKISNYPLQLSSIVFQVILLEWKNEGKMSQLTINLFVDRLTEYIRAYKIVGLCIKMSIIPE